jgi:hypothetical protein
MSVAYYIVLDTEEPEFDTFVNGKAVAHASEELDALCHSSGLPTLDSFMGQSMSEFADLLGEDIELPDGADGETQWFQPSDGIALIESMISTIKRNPTSVTSVDEVLEDLEEYKVVLEKARSIHAQWHLALDI